MKNMPHVWTQEQKDFLREHYPNCTRKELLEKLNAAFELDIRPSQLKGCLGNNNIKSGRTGHYKKGNTPFNKGMKGTTFGGVETQFKKGQRPQNYKPVGYERVDRDGYILVKVSDTGEWHERWRMKQRIVWEKAHGPIPKGQCLVFLDQDKQNVEIDNLRLISRAELARMNQNSLTSSDPEITKTGIIIAGIYSKIGERNKKAKK